MVDRRLISIVEDDEPFRESMTKLVKLLGYTVEAFPSAADFLVSPSLAQTACLVTDVHMPGMTGVELHRHLVETGYAIPTTLTPMTSSGIGHLTTGLFATSASRWTTIISSGACVRHYSLARRLKRIHEPSCAAGRVELKYGPRGSLGYSQLASVAVYDGSANRQTHSDSAGLCGVKRFENSLEISRINTGP